MKNELEETLFNYLVQDGWVVHKEENDKTVKWTLFNKKYDYRDFVYIYNKKHLGISKLLHNLKCNTELGRIKLHYKIPEKVAKVWKEAC